MPAQDPVIATIDRAIALYPKAFPSIDDCPEEGRREFESELELIQKEHIQRKRPVSPASYILP